MLCAHKLQINTLDAITIKRSKECWRCSVGRCRCCCCCRCRCGRSIAVAVLCAFSLLACCCYFATPKSPNKLSDSANNNNNDSGIITTTTTAITRTSTAVDFRPSYAEFIKMVTQLPDAAAERRRDRRFLTFSGGGVVKFVLGVSLPIQLADRARSLSVFYNFQAQYAPPPRPLYWWSVYNTSTFAARRRQRRDASHALVYRLVEAWLDRAGYAGEACLLQAICRVAQRPFHVDGGTAAREQRSVLHALLNAIFIPWSGANVAAKYLHARNAGRYGADCERSFSGCPTHWRWLERISRLL